MALSVTITHASDTPLITATQWNEAHDVVFAGGATGQVPKWDASATSKLKWSSSPVYDVTDYGFVADDATDNTPFLAALLAIIPPHGGTLFFPSANGIYRFASETVITDRLSLRITGSTPSRAGNETLGPLLKYTGATGSLLKFNGIGGLEIDHVRMAYSHAAYGGRLVEFASNVTGSTWVHVHHCALYGIQSSSKTAEALLALTSGYQWHIEHCTFNEALVHIKSTALNIALANDVTIGPLNFFGNAGTVQILMGGQGWHVNRNTFEPRVVTGSTSTNVNEAIDTAAVGVNAFEITGNWFGDGGNSTWIRATGGAMTGGVISGNLFSSIGTAVAINLGSSSGVSVLGNRFEIPTGVVCGSASDITILGNKWFGVTTPVSGTPSGRCLIEDGTQFRVMTSAAATPLVLDGTSAFIQFKTGGVSRGFWGYSAGSSTFDLLDATGVSSLFRVTTTGAGTLASLALNGAAGAGFVELPEQSSAPGTPTNATRFFVDGSNRFSWVGESGHVRTFDGTSLTASRIWTLPDLAGTVALTANKLSAFAATTSAELAGVISDETGSGALVFATSPTLRTHVIVSNNAATLPASSANGVQAGSADSAETHFTADSFAAVPRFITRRANGTAASRTAIASGDFLGAWNANAYDGSAYVGVVSFLAQATQNHSGSQRGTKVEVYTTLDGATSASLTAGFQAGMVVGAPTGSYKGAGSANFAGDLYKNNLAYANPDYVLERWATGRVVRFADREGADRYDGLRPLATVEAFARGAFTLPRIAEAREATAAAGGLGLFAGGDALLATVEEGYVYLFDHEQRIADLTAEVARLRALLERT